MKNSVITSQPVYGVKEITSLIKIPKFDVTRCFLVDFMHSVCLGTVKYLAEVWFDTKNNKEKFYLGLKVKQIDKRLLDLKPYTEISRYPREISQKSQWKAANFTKPIL